MSKRCDAEERWQNCERAYCQQFMKCSVAASSEPVSKLSVTSPAPTPSQQEALNDLRELDTNFEFEGRMAVLRNHLHHFILARPDEVTK